MDNSNGVMTSSKQECVNCGHSVTIYRHVLSSELLIFHNNNGILSRSCSCGCKFPKEKNGEVKISG